MPMRRIFETKPMECPEGKGKTTLIAGWEVKEGEKERETLTYIECKNPRFCWYGSDDCSWGCWDELEKEGKGRVSCR